MSETAELAARAASAFPRMAAASERTRAGWLRAIATVLDDHADELQAIADEETALGETRLRGEIARTSGQLRFFAEVVEDGAHLEAVIDHAAPAMTPPRPDLRRVLRPVGPVAVFAAANFPFAFSVAGGDTASALAVGCPVIVKAHPGHERLSRRTAALVEAALGDAGAPAGAFGIVTGFDAGLALVDHPAVQAIGFTGSVAGGRALHDRAAARPAPIPFHGELGSINPVIVTAAADAARGATLAAGLAASFQLGLGQFCTKPGVVLVPADSALERALPGAIGGEGREGLTGRMLTARIAEGFRGGVDRVRATPGVEVLAGDPSGPDSAGAGALVLACDAGVLVEHAEALLDEVFGPVTLLARCRDAAALDAAVGALPGSLTATLHAEPGEAVADLVGQLERIAGRVLFAGWPTGVAVSWAQQHGGPWPASTSPFTSVGATAVRRFQRPIAYQDAPEALLPAALREANPLRIPRRVDGRLVLPSDAAADAGEERHATR